MNLLAQALQWRDEVANGEMIQTLNRCKECMVIEGGVTKQELDAICDGANVFYSHMGSTLRIGHSCGMLYPAHAWDERSMGHKLKGFFPPAR